MKKVVTYITKCVHCRHLERHKCKDSIGICRQHNVLVLDSLCGCVQQKDGTIKLLNFQLDNDKKDVMNHKYHKIKPYQESAL